MLSGADWYPQLTPSDLRGLHLKVPCAHISSSIASDDLELMESALHSKDLPPELFAMPGPASFPANV